MSDLWRGVYPRFGHTASLERWKNKKKREGKKAGRKSDFLARRGCRGGGNREDEGKARVTYARS